jgi:hypothetical protein
MDTRRIRARDAALVRLRRLTSLLIAGAGVLALAVAGLAAKAFPGRSTRPVGRIVHHVVAQPTRRNVTQSAPPLVSNGSPAPPAPATPQPAPAPTAAPPVVVSGGS